METGSCLILSLRAMVLCIYPPKLSVAENKNNTKAFVCEKSIYWGFNNPQNTLKQSPNDPFCQLSVVHRQVSAFHSFSQLFTASPPIFCLKTPRTEVNPGTGFRFSQTVRVYLLIPLILIRKRPKGKLRSAEVSDEFKDMSRNACKYIDRRKYVYF